VLGSLTGLSVREERDLSDSLEYYMVTHTRLGSEACLLLPDMKRASDIRDFFR